jgi:hypothetical protein
MKNTNQFLVNAAADTSSYTSQAVWSWQWLTASFMAYFSEATAAGTIQLQYSNDMPTGVTNPNVQFTPTNWANVPGSTATATIVAGATGTVYPPVNFVAQWYRIVFTRTGGAGTFSVTYDAFAV